MPSRTASPLANATCIGPDSRCSGMRTRCSCRSAMAASDCSTVPIRTKAHPTPLCACEAITKTSKTSPNSSKHSVSICLVTSRGSRPTKSFTPPFSRSIRGRRSAGLVIDLDLLQSQLGERRPRRTGRNRLWPPPRGDGLRDQRQAMFLPMGAPYRDGERLLNGGDLLHGPWGERLSLNPRGEQLRGRRDRLRLRGRSGEWQ
mmetsp:Transcript_76958/g.152395  ORF Transcript_76958/g.152395 Transcript_76958/m.152395 type:complete len:202 (-) Transcript_76958:162-767(-)